MSLLTALLLLFTCFADGEVVNASASWQQAPHGGEHTPLGLAGEVESEQANDEDPESTHAEQADAAKGVAGGVSGALRGVSEAEECLRHSHGPRPYASRAPPSKG